MLFFLGDTSAATTLALERRERYREEKAKRFAQYEAAWAPKIAEFHRLEAARAANAEMLGRLRAKRA